MKMITKTVRLQYMSYVEYFGRYRVAKLRNEADADHLDRIGGPERQCPPFVLTTEQRQKIIQAGSKLRPREVISFNEVH